MSKQASKHSKVDKYFQISYTTNPFLEGYAIWPKDADTGTFLLLATLELDCVTYLEKVMKLMFLKVFFLRWFISLIVLKTIFVSEIEENFEYYEEINFLDLSFECPFWNLNN